MFFGSRQRLKSVAAAEFAALMTALKTGRLSPEQISYAAMDAWACRELYLQFQRLGLVQ